MDSLPTSIKSLNFVNKKTKYFVHKLNQKDSHSLKLSLKLSDNPNKHSHQLDQINKEQLKKVAMQVQFLGYDKDYCMIFAIYGPKIDRNNKDLLIFTLKRIIDETFYLQNKFKGQATGFKKYCTEGITLIFFNNCLTKKRNKFPFSSKDIFEPLKIDDFKHEVIRELQLKHLVKINDIFLVYPSLLTKSWNFLTSFGLENGFFDTYFMYTESIYDVVLHLGPLFQCHRIDSSVIAYDSSITNKNWRIVYSESQRAHSFNQLTSYEKMCELSSVDNLNNTTQYGYKRYLEEYKLDEKRQVPVILSVLIDYIVANHLKFEGIFRKVAQEKQLIRFENFLLGMQQRYSLSEITRSDFFAQFNQNVTNFEVQTVTSFFKKIFIQLERPLFSEETYSKIIGLTFAQINSFKLNKAPKAQNSSNDIETIHKDECLGKSEAPDNLSNGIGPIHKDQCLGKSEAPDNLQNGIGKIHKDQCLGKLEAPDNLTISRSVHNQFQAQVKVRQRIAFFEKMSLERRGNGEEIQRTVIDHKNPRIQKKIVFKKVSNVRKCLLLTQAREQGVNIVSFEQMKSKDRLEYKVLRQTINLLREVKRQQRHNLMSVNNLAICFSPCFFRKPVSVRKSMEVSIEEECYLNIKLVKVLEKLIQSEDLAQDNDI